MSLIIIDAVYIGDLQGILQLINVIILWGQVLFVVLLY